MTDPAPPARHICACAAGATPADGVCRDFVDKIVPQLGRTPEATLPILQAIQKEFRWLPEAALRRVSEVTDISQARLFGAATFYTQFRLRPAGEHAIHVCHGTACHVKGSPLIDEALRRLLDIAPDSDTDPTGKYTVHKAACLGCCTLAPAIRLDETVYGKLSPDGVERMLHDFQRRTKTKTAALAAANGSGNFDDSAEGEIRVGVGSCCVVKGGEELCASLSEAVERRGVAVRVKPVGCVGACHRTPLVEVIVPGREPVSYGGLTPDDAEAVVRRHFEPRGVWRFLRNAVSVVLEQLLTDETWPAVTRHAVDHRDGPTAAFFGPQKHLATEHFGRLCPEDPDEYEALGGFAALRKCLSEMTPDRTLAAVDASGLRGRGGAGFPTGKKWAAVRKASGKNKFIVCNGDEGDPGAFMDRMLLESFPFRVIEGAIIAAYAVGAAEGCFYIRAEYPLAVQRIRHALKLCNERGLLGDNILGQGFSLRLEVREGAGAFVCGEETALLASLEGNRGNPRLRPPYPAESGYQGRPTLVNNVETFALVPWILRHGAEAFAALGTPSSRGTKVFALAGKVARGGLIEVPMGVTLREIVENIGGGAAGGKRFKAVQVGGPSGGCVPAEQADVRVDYEELTAVGAMMGSGGLVVLDEDDCMVDIARYFLEFTQDQSCGRCSFCRLGTRRLLEILQRICAGQGKVGDLEDLEQLARQVQAGSLCGLGRTAPNPVLSTLRWFREEYEEHLRGRCPAGRCRALVHYRVTQDCIGCTLCAQQCPTGAIPFSPYCRHQVDDAKCIRCGVCRSVCPRKAVRVE